jgi:peptide/nickel transport system substrate-binding protein
MINQALNNRYQITARLGKGAMGTVYRATDLQSGKDVALKIISSDLVVDPDMLERFQREGEALSKLKHPNIVGFIDTFQHDENYVIVMEYISGGSLYDLIKAGPLPIERARQITLDLCDALIRAHRLDIIHRDLKPENILIDEDGTPKLADFGVARLSEGTRMTRSGTQVGTPYYMSPEAWEGKMLDAQADIWSLGVILFEMLAGQVPFGGDTGAAVMNKVLTASPPDLKKLRAEVPSSLVKIVSRMLTRDKKRRYQTMRQVAVDLESVQLITIPQRSKVKPAVSQQSILKWVIISTIGLGAIASGTWGLSYFNSPSTPVPTILPATNPPTEVTRIAPTQTGVSEPSSPGIEAPNNLRSPEPKIFTEALGNINIDTLDPALAYDIASARIIQNTYETLVFYDRQSTDEFVPLLAESWELSDNGKVWTFHIRENVKFHNGDDLTPTDVAYSFQRGLLQGGTASPQWLLAEPFFGIGVDDITKVVDPNGGLIDNRAALQAFSPIALNTACEKVLAAIVADDTAGTVTMTLEQAWSPFLSTIAQPWASIMDKNWVIENQGWDGSCSTWQDFYAMQSADNPFSTIENGTGPFKLESYKPDEELVLTRSEDYWREPAKLERVTLIHIPEWPDRFAVIESGSADSAEVPVENLSQMDELAGERCEFDADAGAYQACEVVNNSNPLRVRLGGLNPVQFVILFNFDISPSDNSFIGSGQLDGNGIPIDFFNDIHIRKAFAYCFDWDAFIANVHNGEATQSFQLPLPGMPGYFGDSPHYSLDLAKCEEEFKLADLDKDGIPAGQDPNDVWDIGFRIQLAYNQDHLTRQNVAEILSSNISSINGNFRVETLGLPLDTYRDAQNAFQLPIIVGGWVEDIHDPHNWFQPYTLGTYASRQNLPSEIMSEFQGIINRGLAETDPTKRANIYNEANELYHDQAIGLPLALSTTHTFEQRWVFGTVSNPLFPGRYYYSIYKQ